MSNPDQTSVSGETGAGPEIHINPLIIQRSRWAFQISLFAFVGFLIVIFFPPIFGAITKYNVRLIDISEAPDSNLLSFVAAFLPHFLLFIVTIVSAYIGYKLVVASGANPENPIPPANYKLLAPLIADGKAESIDQYVRLSSLSGFTGMFTKLGLTGLPLTTVILTLIFAALSLLPIDPETKKNFIDLTKLTLGAFIGSFVQRQVEQRKTTGAPDIDRDQSRALQ